MSEARYRKGRAMKRRLFGAGQESPVPAGHLAEDLLRLTDEMVFGGVYTRRGLDLRTRSLVTLAALTVLGKDDYLRRHLRGALHVGIAPATIKEVLMQMAFYGGIPCALRALAIAHEEFAARRGGTVETARRPAGTPPAPHNGRGGGRAPASRSPGRNGRGRAGRLVASRSDAPPGAPSIDRPRRRQPPASRAR